MHLTPYAKRVIDLAYDEARQLKNEYIGTEHLLLGLIRQGDGLAAKVLSKLGVELEGVRREVALVQEKSKSEVKEGNRVGSSQSRSVVDPFLSRLSGLMASTYQIAKRLKASPGPEHLFLAVLEDPASPAVKALESLGITPEQVEQAMKDLDNGDESKAD
jgi:ATP-dependent Clp protease ATP-binding subunit ClpC